MKEFTRGRIRLRDITNTWIVAHRGVRRIAVVSCSALPLVVYLVLTLHLGNKPLGALVIARNWDGEVHVYPGFAGIIDVSFRGTETVFGRPLRWKSTLPYVYEIRCGGTTKDLVWYAVFPQYVPIVTLTLPAAITFWIVYRPRRRSTLPRLSAAHTARGRSSAGG